MPTKRKSVRRIIKSKINITPDVTALYIALVDQFCKIPNDHDERFDTDYMQAHDKLNDCFSHIQTTIDETFLRDAPPDWMVEHQVNDWLQAHAIRLQLDAASNIEWTRA